MKNEKEVIGVNEQKIVLSEEELDQVTGGSGLIIGQNAGNPEYKCPQCGSMIQTSMYELIVSTMLTCPNCGLKLNIDPAKSKNIRKVLQQLRDAKESHD